MPLNLRQDVVVCPRDEYRAARVPVATLRDPANADAVLAIAMWLDP
jgi:hypothetical protein